MTCTGTTGTPATATFTWTNGGEETQWLLEYALDEDFTNPTQVTVNQSDLVNGAYTLDNNLTTDQQYYARIKAWCPSCGAAGEYSNASNTCPFKPTNTVFIGNGTNTSGYAPLYGNYKSSYDQMIYTASQLDAVGINADGTISKIGFKSSATNTYKRNVKIYMGHTDKTAFSSNTDFVAYDD